MLFTSSAFYRTHYVLYTTTAQCSLPTVGSSVLSVSRRRYLINYTVVRRQALCVKCFVHKLYITPSGHPASVTRGHEKQVIPCYHDYYIGLHLFQGPQLLKIDKPVREAKVCFHQIYLIDFWVHIRTVTHSCFVFL